MKQIFALIFFAAGLFAQSGTSTISGVVRDPSNAPLAGAKVALANTETGVRQETSSNEEGIYRFPSLVAGSYSVEASADGFQTVNRSPVVVQVSQ